MHEASKFRETYEMYKDMTELEQHLWLLFRNRVSHEINQEFQFLRKQEVYITYYNS